MSLRELHEALQAAARATLRFGRLSNPAPARLELWVPAPLGLIFLQADSQKTVVLSQLVEESRSGTG